MPNSDPIVAYATIPQPAFVCAHASVGLDAAWVEVAGELDIATTPQLERTLREAQSSARLVVLDLRNVTFMDCSGVHVIV
jgi:anti-anti-sigma factor